jgi:hypothetical protein
MKYQLAIQKEMALKTESEKALKSQVETLTDKVKKVKEKLQD